ncbi:MAG: FHA domain-containing protein [Cyanophyceae cyanobacterium]
MIWLLNPHTKKRFEVTGKVFRVGRSPDCHLTINSRRVSRVHFTLVKFSEEESGYTLFDGDFEEARPSRNGVKVGWTWVVGSQILKHNDHIIFAGQSLIYQQPGWTRPPHLTVF